MYKLRIVIDYTSEKITYVKQGVKNVEEAVNLAYQFMSGIENIVGSGVSDLGTYLLSKHKGATLDIVNSVNDTYFSIKLIKDVK